MSPAEIQTALDHETGSEQLYRHSLARDLVFTSGVHHMRELCNAFWLVDAIASHVQHSKAQIPDLQFQMWKLAVKDQVGILTCGDGNDKIVTIQEIGFTDFPLEEISFYCVPYHTGFILMLTTEY